MKLNQKGFSPIEGILILIIVGIIGFVGYFVYSANKDDSKTAESSSEKYLSHDSNVAMDDFFVKFKEQLGMSDIKNKVRVIEKSKSKRTINIQDDDNFATAVNSKELEIILKGENSCSDPSVACDDSFENTLSSVSDIKLLDALLKNTSKDNGLVENKDNSAKNHISDRTLTINYSVYENSSFLCVLTSPVKGTFIEGSELRGEDYLVRFGCADKKNYEAQKDIQKQLSESYDLIKINKDNEFTLGRRIVINSIDFMDSDFFAATLSDSSYVIWKKVNDKWEHVLQGFEVTPCAEVDGKGVPVSILKSTGYTCDDSGKLRIIRS